MSLFHRSILKAPFLSAAALFLFTGSLSAQSDDGSVIKKREVSLKISKLTISSGDSIALPIRNVAEGTLEAVTITLTLPNQAPEVIYDTTTPNQNFVNISSNLPTGNSPLTAWEVQPNHHVVNLSFIQQPTAPTGSPTVSKRDFPSGPPSSPGSNPSGNTFANANLNTASIKVDYTFACSSATATPEPGASYLSAIAAGAMALLLIGRRVHRA